jgi:uncharacterized protein (DUF2267 family)
MKENSLIETFGTITKKEKLASIEESFSNGVLILENKIPFPGYHGDTIPDQKALSPDSVFMVTKQAYDEETIVRISHEIKKQFKKKFDTAPGFISLQNETAPCLRVKFLSDFSKIEKLVDLYKENGIQFAKYKNVNDYEAIIKVKKFFLLSMSVPGLYMDEDNLDFCYVQIPMHLDWETFEKLTLEIKRNMEDYKFDAALGTIFRKNCVVDVIRIFGKHIDHEKLGNIKDRYLKAVKKLKNI